jgi:hypothetical protein
VRSKSAELVASPESPVEAIAVFDALADLTLIPDWRLWMSPTPGFIRPTFDVRQVDGRGTRAAPGVAVDVVETGGSFMFLGRRLKEAPRTHRFTTELVHRPHRVRLGYAVDTTDIGGWSAFDFVIAQRRHGCLVTLHLESEITGSGSRAHIALMLAGNATPIAEGTLARAVALAGDLSALDDDRWHLRSVR